MKTQKHKPFLVSFLFVAVDAITIYMVFLLMIWLRTLLAPVLTNPFNVASTSSTALQVMLACLILFIAFDFYPGYGFTAVKKIEQMTKAITLVFIIISGVSFFGRTIAGFSRFVLLGTYILVAIFLPVVHFLVRNLLSRTPFYGIPVAIYGEASFAKTIQTALADTRRIGWVVTKKLPLKAALNPGNDATKGKIAILALDNEKSVIAFARELSVVYKKVVIIRERENFGSYRITPRDIGGFLGLEYTYHLLARWSPVAKRLMDVFLGSVLLILAAPILAIIALCIKLESSGSVFYRQQRLGQNFMPFELIKFRTMVENADAYLKNVLDNNPELMAEYRRFHKLANDPRVTRVGKFLRKHSLDELPQLFHVITGKMSLVGPRPYLVAEQSEMGEYAKIILRVKPGMTGLWQVLWRNKVSFRKRLMLDENYIKNWSIWMDEYIFMKTIGVVIKGKGM